MVDSVSARNCTEAYLSLSKSEELDLIDRGISDLKSVGIFHSNQIS